MTQKPLVLKVSEVASLLRVQRAKVYVLIDEGCLSAYKVGGDWRVRLDSLERLIGELPESMFEHKKAA